MKSTGLAFLAAWLLMAPAGVLADGCFIPPTAFAKVEIPDQRALIHYANGAETLVIDTSFKGEGTNFAWIVPVPSQPKVEAATTGLFPTLQAIFQPEIIHNVDSYYKFAIVIGAFVFSLVFTKRRGGSIITTIGSWFMLLVLAGMLLPALGSVGVSIGTPGNVAVLERKTVGVYETATLASRNGGALLDWLNKNGFAIPTNLTPGIRAYAGEGWDFVASKVRLDAPASEVVKAHPLSFTFKTDHPVYPLRLTAVGNESCRIDLYVFGQEEAAVPNFTVERCVLPQYPQTDERFYRDYDLTRIRHPLLRSLAARSTVATKLTAELSNAQMQKDGYISWIPYEEKRLRFYSCHGAAVLASNISVSLLVMGLLGWYCARAGIGSVAQNVCRISRFAIITGILCWVPIYMALPKVPVNVARLPSLRVRYLHHAVASELQDMMGSNPSPDLAWLRQQLQAGSPLRKASDPINETNLFSGLPWRDEDSPGNCTVRQGTNGFEYVWYDIDGAEQVIPLTNAVQQK